MHNSGIMPLHKRQCYGSHVGKAVADILGVGGGKVEIILTWDGPLLEFGMDHY